VAVGKRIIQVDEKLPFVEMLPLSLQHLFAMFGGTVLVPLLLNVNPSTSLLFNGIGTLVYLLITKGKIPAYLGSSFAFLSPVMVVMASHGSEGYSAAQAGFIAFGLSFIIFSIIIKYTGTEWLEIIFPPSAMGAIVAVIGLELAPNASEMAGFSGALSGNISQELSILVAIFTLCVTIFGSIFFKGFLSAMPILIGVLAGYILCMILGVVDYSIIENAPWIELPTLYYPKLHLDAVLIILPVTFVVLAEHIGHLVVTGNIVGKDLTKSPGLHRSLLGDGISNLISGILGAPPNTTYGENIGVMAITKVYSVWVIGGAAVIAILISFLGKITAFIHSIPKPVMGGICFILFGVIATTGIRMLIEKKVDYSKPKNIMLTSLVLIIGISGASLKLGSIEIKGMALATLASICLNIIFVIFKKNED
jgi:uracil permease